MPRSPEGPRTPSQSIETKIDKALEEKIGKVVQLRERRLREARALLRNADGPRTPSREEVREYIDEAEGEWMELCYELLGVDDEARFAVVRNLLGERDE